MPDIQTRYQHIVKYTAEKANGSDSLGVTRWVEAGPEDFRDFVTVLGRYMYATQIKMFHEQDCCEDARIGDGEK